jgi:hypothetical protein
VGYRERRDTVYPSLASMSMARVRLEVELDVAHFDGPCSGFASVCPKR